MTVSLSTQILILAILPLLFISFSILREFAMLPDRYILLSPQEEEMHNISINVSKQSFPNYVLKISGYIFWARLLWLKIIKNYYKWPLKVCELKVWVKNTAWKESKHGVFSISYSPAFGLNTDQKKLRIWTLFMQC